MSVYNIFFERQLDRQWLPDGYIAGQGRGNSDYDLPDETHLYEGDFGNVGNPMCPRGWNRDFGTSLSIWRNNVGEEGVCPECERRAKLGLSSIPPMFDSHPYDEMKHSPWDGEYWGDIWWSHAGQKYSAIADEFVERSTRPWRRMAIALGVSQAGWKLERLVTKIKLVNYSYQKRLQRDGKNPATAQ